MRYIDKTGCKSAFEKGNNKEITSLAEVDDFLKNLDAHKSTRY